MKVHVFDTSGEAYDASQWRDDIHDGDVLHVPAEGSAAILLAAWPTTVVEGYVPDVNGAFGAPLPGCTIEDVIRDGNENVAYAVYHGRTYEDSIAKARELVKDSLEEALRPHPQSRPSEW